MIDQNLVCLSILYKVDVSELVSFVVEFAVCYVEYSLQVGSKHIGV